MPTAELDDLDEGQVRELVRRGETLTVEFKSELEQPLSDRALAEAVVCLANGDGGYLLVGVEDDGTISGARPRHEAGITDTLRLEALIANSTVPPVQAAARTVTLDGRAILVIAVEDSARVVGTSAGTYLRRARGGDGRPACVPFHAHEMLAYQIDRGIIDFATLPLPSAQWEDLDPLEFERFRRMVRQAGPRRDAVLAALSDREIARALGVLDPGSDNRPLAGALLLFGRDDSLARLVRPTRRRFRSFAARPSQPTSLSAGPCCASPRSS